MKKTTGKKEKRKGRPLLFSILLVFCILGSIVYAVSRKIEAEMSSSAIQNLSESLDLIQCTIEAILGSQADFQILVAQEIARMEDPESYILGYESSQTMSRLSLIRAGETAGVSSSGGAFTEEGLDFSAGSEILGLPVSRSQTIAVSRWLVMPMPASSRTSTPLWASASMRTPYWLDQISMGSCSTQPGFG